RYRATLTRRMAGCVFSVSRNRSSGPRRMISERGKPRMRSAVANNSRVSADAAQRSAPMPTSCDPCPGNTKATLVSAMRLGDCDGGVQVDVLDDVEQLDTLGHRSLERLAARDQAGAAGALVDDGGLGRVVEVILAGGAARIDQAHAAHVTAGHLVAGEVDGVVGGQCLVDQLVGLAELEGVVTAVGFRLLLLDDVG